VERDLEATRGRRYQSIVTEKKLVLFWSGKRANAQGKGGKGKERAKVREIPKREITQKCNHRHFGGRDKGEKEKSYEGYSQGKGRTRGSITPEGVSGGKTVPSKGKGSKYTEVVPG